MRTFDTVLNNSKKEQIVRRVWTIEGSEAQFYLLIHLIHCVVRSVTATDSGWQRIQTIYRDPAATVRGISMTDCHLLTEYWENRYRPLSPSQPGRWERYLQILESSSWQFSDIYCHITFSHTITIWGGATSKLSMSIVSFMLSDTIYHRRSWPPFVLGARIYWTYSDFLNSFPTT